MYKTNRRTALFNLFFERARAQPQTATARPRASIWRAFGAGVASLGSLRAMPGAWSEPETSLDGREPDW